MTAHFLREVEKKTNMECNDQLDVIRKYCKDEIG